MPTAPVRRPALLAAGLSALVLALAACDGDDDDPAPAPPPTGSLSGTVVDGRLAGAKVCLDLNDNRVCDAAEASVLTDAQGQFTLAGVEESALAQHAVLAEATAGTTTDTDYGAVARSFTLAAPPGKGAFISPFTTLVLSELDGGRAVNLAQAEETILDVMVGTAGDVGGLNLYGSYLTAADGTGTGTAVNRGKMTALGQLLTRGYAETRAASGLTGKEASGALGLAATGSLQQLLAQVTVGVTNGSLPLAVRDTLFAGVKDSLVPTPASLAAVAAARGKTAAQPIEGAWVATTTGPGGRTVRLLYLFAGDGTFVHQVIDTGTSADNRTFDDGFGTKYGRYTYAGSTLTTTLIEASEAAGPGNGATPAVLAGDAFTIGGVAYSRVASATDALVGGWVRPDGSATPEYLVLLADGTYVHGTFYNQNDPQTGTASFFETAKSAGLALGTYARNAANANVVDFGATSVDFNGNLSIPGNPGVASLQSDGSLSMSGLRVVRLGTALGAKAVTGLSEATRSRLWSGRYFSRTVTMGGANRTQYVYVRGPADVITFLQAPAGADASLPCGSNPAVQGTPVVDFTTVDPADGKLKQFVIGTSTNATALYAQRRLNVGTPASFVSYTPITRPTNATARCVVPL